MKKQNIFRRILNAVEDTVRGDNALGQKLNKVLPAKALREGVGAAVLGVKDAVPLPQIADSGKQEKIERVKRIIQEKNITKEDVKSLDPEELQAMTYQLFDLVDDGRLNKSADALSAETKLKIRLGVSFGTIAYIIYAVTTGDYALGELLVYFYGQ
jgi:hypothetical protein